LRLDVRGGLVKRIPLVLVLFAAACSSSQGPKAPPPAAAVAPSPTPGILSRTDPNVIEETETYVIRRLPKSQYIKVDATHIRLPIVQRPIEFFKEDENYYYTSTPKYPADETALKQQAALQTKDGTAPSGPPQPVVPLSEFEDLTPPVGEARIRLVEVESSGLPKSGMWRASFALDDINGDGVIDIIAPPARLGDGRLKVWIGDGKGGFTAWKLSYSEEGKTTDRLTVDYGGVAVGDIDADGKKDIVLASHGVGLVSLFGDGKGGFRILRAGLPQSDFSSQTVALLDADGDGKLDIVASRDVPGEATGAVDKQQVRIYLFRGLENGWEFRRDGLVGGFFSYSLKSWDYDGDGRKDVLTGSNQSGALTLLWKNEGNGTFSPVSFPDVIEPYAFHFITTPGTFGPQHLATFADSFTMGIVKPERLRASGVSLYTFENGQWARHRVWRRKNPKGNVLAIAMGDLDGDRLDDIVFGDDEKRRLRVIFQQADGGFVEGPEATEPTMDSPGQSLRLADLDGDGRLDLVLALTVSTSDPTNPGGWKVYLNKP
jgi:hypothetical protein